MRARIWVAICLVSFAIVSATPVSAQDAVDYARLNKSIADGHILPRYQALATATRDFAQTAEGACRRRSAESIGEVRGGFHAVTDRWAAIQHIRFGPIEDEDRYLRIEFWPDKKNIVSRHLSRLLAAQDAAALDPKTFAETSVAVQGLPALERLLFDDDAEAAFVAKTPAADYRCRVTTRIAANLADIGADMAAAWQPNGIFYKIFTEPAAENPVYLTADEATLDLHGALLSGMEIVRDLKLGRPLGASAKRARPRRAEFWRSGRAVRGAAFNLKALIALYAGDGENHGGFREEILRHGGGEDLDATVYQGLTLAADILKDVEPDIAVAVKDPDERRRLLLVLAQLDFLKGTIRSDLAGILGLGLGFNATDGD